MRCETRSAISTGGFAHILLGLLLGVCLVLLLGAGGSGNTGRYQCCAAGNDDFAVFVTDTQTGQTWRLGRADTYDFGAPYARKSIRSSETPIVR